MTRRENIFQLILSPKTGNGGGGAVATHKAKVLWKATVFLGIVSLVICSFNRYLFIEHLMAYMLINK